MIEVILEIEKQHWQVTESEKKNHFSKHDCKKFRLGTNMVVSVPPLNFKHSIPTTKKKRYVIPTAFVVPRRFNRILEMARIRV